MFMHKQHKPTRHLPAKFWHTTMFAFSVIVLLFFGPGNLTTFAVTDTCSKDLSDLDCQALWGDWGDWVPDTCAIGDSTSTSGNGSGTGDATVELNANQLAIARIIMGIAKTENLGQQGAIIGIMTGLTESHLKIYANTGIPISMTNPSRQDEGHDHDSLGVMQQRVSTNWSTISTNPNDKATVYQLMDPAYNAEAFFGSPPDAKGLPSALRKGLQNVSNWQTKDPWIAAQKVQVSAFRDGSNYRKNYKQALNIVNKYYDDAATVAVPLPVALNGTTNTSTSTSDACDSTGTNDFNCTSPTSAAKILCEAQKYKGIYYQLNAGHSGRAAYVRGCPDPTNPPNNQPHGSGHDNNGNPSPCAVDCSSLVSMAVDDAFGTKFDWTVADIVSDPAHWEKISRSQAQPGDVVTKVEGSEHHVEIFVSQDGGKLSTFGAHSTGTQVSGRDNVPQSYYNGTYHYIGPGSS